MSALAFNLPRSSLSFVGRREPPHKRIATTSAHRTKEPGEYQHCPRSFNKSAIPSFNNAILLRSSQNGLLVGNADAFIVIS
ncbi:hypothetical protein Tco_0379317 [Tanacetum coccineum]